MASINQEARELIRYEIDREWFDRLGGPEQEIEPLTEQELRDREAARFHYMAELNEAREQCAERLRSIFF